MAEDMEDEVEEEAEGPKKGGGKKKLLLIILPVLLLIGIGGGVYFSGLLGGGAKKEEAPGEAHPATDQSKAGQGKEATSASAGQTATFYDLPEMLVDINSDGRKRSFLKIRVSLELAGPGDVAAIEAVMPRVIDSFQVYLREMRLEDLQGAEGLYRLREELLIRVNAAVSPVKVSDVLFKEMLVQ